MANTNVRSVRDWGPGAFLALDIGYLVVLAVVLISRQTHWFEIDQIPNPIGGIVPVAVPWFGALGAVTISLYGVSDHDQDWNKRWNRWHVARPFVGVVLGTMAYLIFVGVIQATGSTTTPASSTPAGPTSLIPYLIVSFAVGFREQTFRSLIQKVIDTLLSPNDPPPPVGIAVSPSPAPFDDTAVGATTHVTLTVTNTGSSNLRIDTMAPQSPGIEITPGDFTLQDNAVAGATIAPSAQASVTVVFTPTAAGDRSGTLTIHSNAGTTPINLVATGV